VAAHTPAVWRLAISSIRILSTGNCCPAEFSTVTQPGRKGRRDSFLCLGEIELTRNSRTITNPTGLILATVPQCFVGSTFEEFRRRLERHAKLEAEEAERKRKQEAELAAWIMKDRERYESIVSDPTKSEKERETAEKRLREIADWRS
jgi:hypothetical protein